MKVVVFGAGAVGSALSASLSKNENIDLTLVARKNHVDKINSNGLILFDNESEKKYKIKAVEQIDNKLSNTLLILTVKAHSLKTAIEQLYPYITDTTEIFYLQNGLFIEETINDGLKDKNCKMYRGVVATGAAMLEAGKVEFHGGGIKAEKSFENSQFSTVFDNGFMRFKISDDLIKDVWNKVCVNCIVNPLSVLLRAKNRTTGDDRFNELKSKIIAEVTEVAASYGVDISMNVEKFNKFILTDNVTSMYQDYIHRRKSEIEFINGAVSKLGKEKGIATPVNDTITDLIKAAEIIRIENNDFSN